MRLEAGTSDERGLKLLAAGLRGALLFGNGFLFLRGRVALLDIEWGKAANDPADFFFAAREAARNLFERNGWTGLPGHIVETAEANAAHRVDLALDRHFVDVLTRSLALISPLRVPRVRDLPRAHTRSGAPAM